MPVTEPAHRLTADLVVEPGLEPEVRTQVGVVPPVLANSPDDLQPCGGEVVDRSQERLECLPFALLGFTARAIGLLQPLQSAGHALRAPYRERAAQVGHDRHTLLVECHLVDPGAV